MLILLMHRIGGYGGRYQACQAGQFNVNLSILPCDMLT